MLKIAWSPIYEASLPKGHRFPMEKYELIPKQLLFEGTITEENLFAPIEIAEENILAIHSADYWNKLKNLTLTKLEERRTGFPLNKQFIRRSRHIAQASIDCMHFAQQFGVSMNVAGGTHHAYQNHGEGFCLINDFAIAASFGLRTKLFKKALIIDLDVHQGNGTAHIFREEERVYTFSMHCAENFPLRKEQSNLDIALKANTNGSDYLAILSAALDRLISQVQAEHIFYLSGVDVLETDRLGKLSLTKADCMLRDRLVLEKAKSAGIPISISMGGGYSRHIKDIIDAHCNTFRMAHFIYF